MAIVNSAKFNFRDEVMTALTRYSALAFDSVYEAVDEVSKESVKRLKKESPKGASGKYAKGWTYTPDKGRLKVGATIHGKIVDTWATAHLLEHGHVSRNGTGRTYGTVKEIVHIAPVEEWATGELEDRIITKLADKTATV